MFSGGIEKQHRAVMDELKLERIRSFLKEYRATLKLE